jgi:hypothetical protein
VTFRKEDKDAIAAAFTDMALHGQGFTRMTPDGIKHIPYDQVKKDYSLESVAFEEWFNKEFGYAPFPATVVSSAAWKAWQESGKRL